MDSLGRSARKALATVRPPRPESNTPMGAPAAAMVGLLAVTVVLPRFRAGVMEGRDRQQAALRSPAAVQPHWRSAPQFQFPKATALRAPVRQALQVRSAPLAAP